ncbi:M3 family metallopeptidase [Paeniglutamicibacter psychrophenolicus]|uniref:Peptidyl-dipeptidase Dcp n=1 Tax=Paeniglutamicibacter psychrophenolicus TaxID=257454 RepID=A0ABS4WH40_9MICC|nr:M3 family metallopeptidase [Paeniglutamicibacter psychrophenolicus]MBP2374889.1 peptidyl-dipeptidase Dcp [Paeniglutamicibacter psychrophenolicus]
MHNPLLERSTLPFEFPDYSALEAAHYLDAVQQGVAGQLEELRAIAQNTQAPTFENTFVAMERSGALLRRAVMAYWTVFSAHGTDELREIDPQIQSLVSGHQDAIHLDGELFARLASLDADALGGEDKRLVTETLRTFRAAGAELDAGRKEQLRALNSEITDLSSEYSRRLLGAMNEAAVHFADPGELAGLSDGELASAADAARDAGHTDGYLLTLVLPTGQPLLERLEFSASRRRLFEASVNRGQEGDNLTLDLGARMASLRSKRAALLGFATHADVVLQEATAPDLAAVRGRLAELIPAAVANARAEAGELEKISGSPIDPWDWAYYSAAVARERHALDRGALREYFELDAVLERGVFAAASRLYGLGFTERFDFPLYHPDVRTWEVFNEDGSTLGLFVGDFFARPTKAGGAWMNSIRESASLLGERPVVTNTLNIPKPAEGDPALVSLDEVNTLFHEFGHALHGLFSAGIYPSLAGTSVPRDFVEYPSQVNEMWALHAEVLPGYAAHTRTGEPLPDGTVQVLEAAALWGEGFATTEYLTAAVLDLAWHSLTDGELVSDPLAFEQRVLSEAGLIPELVPSRYRTGYFKHIFDGGYSAGYYSYIWSEVLDADTVEWFTENGGLKRENGERFRAELLSRGNTRDPLESYEIFRGREARIEPLLVRRGLARSTNA